MCSDPCRGPEPDLLRFLLYLGHGTSDKSTDLKTIPVHVFIRGAPDCAARRSKKELLNRHSINIDSKKIGESVVALDELRIQEENAREQDKNTKQ